MLKKHWVILGLFLLAPAAFAEEDAQSAEGHPPTFGALGGFTAGQGQSLIRVGVGMSGSSGIFPFNGAASTGGIGARAAGRAMVLPPGLGGLLGNKEDEERSSGGGYGLQLKFMYGVTSSLDVGGIFELNGEDIGRDAALRFLIPARFGFFNNGRIGISAGAALGLALGVGGGVVVTIPLPMDVTMAARLTRNFILVTGFEMPLEIWTKSKINAYIPFVGALGFEYAVASSVKVWAKYRWGHTYSARPSSMPGGPGSDLLLGVAFAL